MTTSWGTVATAGGLLAICLLASPAQAANPVYVRATDEVGAGTQWFAQANCPAGSRVVGGGVTNPASHEDNVFVNVTSPTDGPDADTKRNDSWIGFIDNVSGPDPIEVTVYAICVKRKLKRGLAYKRRSAMVDPNSQGSATARCPDGAKVVGGGVSNSASYGDAWVNATRPEDGPDARSKRDDAWIGFVDNFTTGDLEITTHAICAKRKPLKRGLKYKRTTSEIASDTQGFASAVCPPGAKVLGGGITNPASWNSAWVNATRPEDGPDPRSKRDDAWIGFVENYTLGLLKITAFAICHDA